MGLGPPIKFKWVTAPSGEIPGNLSTWIACPCWRPFKLLSVWNFEGDNEFIAIQKTDSLNQVTSHLHKLQPEICSHSGNYTPALSVNSTLGECQSDGTEICLSGGGWRWRGVRLLIFLGNLRTRLTSNVINSFTALQILIGESAEETHNCKLPTRTV